MMGDEEEGHAVVLHAPHVVEQLADLPRFEPRSRFIEYDEARAEPQSARDLQ